MLTTATKRPPTQAIPGTAVEATPPEDLEADEAEVTDEGEVVKRVAVKSPVDDAEVLMSDKLEDPLLVTEAAKLDSEPEEAELALTMLLIDRLVAILLADMDVDTGRELETAFVVAMEIE